MRQHSNHWPRAIAAVLALALGVAWTAPPAAAAESSPAAKPKTLAAAAEAKLATLDTSKGVQFAQAGGAAGSASGKPFFKSTKGLAAAVLMVGGMAWMVASRQSDDVVHSPAR